ncbi:MAG TPA: hypothetical protein VFU17_03195 [Candidatus Limnocylindrales bacterium]|nr:hypothetical protein [Candidatus Limnocylindrales bacterium]
MTSELDVDRILEDWFAQGPSRLPDRVITETVEQLDHTKRRRYVLSPGRERMTRLLIAGTGLAAALVAAVVGFATLTGGDGIGVPDGVTYTSDRHGYSVFLPDGWTVEERPGTWEVGEFFDANSEDGVDYFEDVNAEGIPTLYVYLASQDIPGGMSFEEWTARNDVATTASQPCFALVGSHESRPVDGETARVGTYHCDDFDGAGSPYTGVQTLVAHDGRGYAIYVWPAPLPGFQPAGWEYQSTSELQAAAAEWLDRLEFTN